MQEDNDVLRHSIDEQRTAEAGLEAAAKEVMLCSPSSLGAVAEHWSTAEVACLQSIDDIVASLKGPLWLLEMGCIS